MAQQKALEVAEKEFTPGDNYGFSGAADTKGYVYRYLSDYVRTLWYASKLDAAGCVEGFSSALREYAIYNCDGDPKGSVHAAIKEAPEVVERQIENAYTRMIEARGPNGSSPVDASITTGNKAPDTKVETRANLTRARPTKFDVFISFKNLDAEGRETRDCAMAKQISAALERSGLSVFFSLDSLERMGVSAYKTVIDEALDQAQVLVAVGTSREHLESRWVKYEWDGFLKDIIENNKPDARVFVVIENVQPRELPRGLRQCKTFQFSEPEIDRLIRFIGSSEQ